MTDQDATLSSSVNNAHDVVLRDLERRLRWHRFSAQDAIKIPEVARMLVAATRCSSCGGAGIGFSGEEPCLACHGTGVDPTRLDAALREGERDDSEIRA